MADDLEREITAAMYYLVWHLGLSYETAVRVVSESEKARREFARFGHIEGRGVFRALEKIIARICVKGG